MDIVPRVAGIVRGPLVEALAAFPQPTGGPLNNDVVPALVTSDRETP